MDTLANQEREKEQKARFKRIVLPVLKMQVFKKVYGSVQYI